MQNTWIDDSNYSKVIVPDLVAQPFLLDNQDDDDINLMAWLPCCRLTTTVVILMAIIYLTFKSLRQHDAGDAESPLPLPPGTMGWPLIGETLSFLANSDDFFKTRREAYGPVYKTHLLGQPTVRIMGGARIRGVLVTEPRVISTQWPRSARRLLGTHALSMMTGHAHRHARKHILKAFGQRTLSASIPHLQSVFAHQLGSWLDHHQANRGQLHAYPACQRAMFHVAIKVMLGLQMSDDTVSDLMGTFDTILQNLFSLPVNIPGMGFYKGMKAREKVMKVLSDAIKAKLSAPHDKYEENILSNIHNGMKLEAEDTVDREEVMLEQLCESALEVMFTAHGTTSSAACSALIFLTQHPQVVQKLRQEIHRHCAVVGAMAGAGGCASGRNCERADAGKCSGVGKCTSDREHARAGVDENSVLCGGTENVIVTYKDLQRMGYLENIIKEVLRLEPPAGGAFRKVMKTFELDGYQIPAGWNLVYAIRDTHIISQSPYDGATFNPDRWLRESLSTRSQRQTDHAREMVTSGKVSQTPTYQFQQMICKKLTAGPTKESKALTDEGLHMVSSKVTSADKSVTHRSCDQVLSPMPSESCARPSKSSHTKNREQHDFNRSNSLPDSDQKENSNGEVESSGVMSGTKVTSPTISCEVSSHDSMPKSSDFIPFGHGPRACPGRELAKIILKVFVIELVSKYDFKSRSGNVVEMKSLPVPHPVDGFPLLMSKRH